MVSVLPLDSIVCGDSCDVLGTFPRDCIDLVVTSPPYDDLRTYGSHEWDFYGVAWLLKRVLKPGGVIVWVVCDETKHGDESGSSWTQAQHFRAIGLNLHDTMIYHKPGCRFPRFGHSKYCDAWEYMFVFTKGKAGTFNSIRDAKNATAGQMTSGTVRLADGSMKRGHSKGRPVADVGERNNVWPYAVGYGKTTADTFAFEHPAMFPEKLAGDHIASWTNEGDTVLDPFNGSGTTTKMAREMGRHYIGIEVNEEYCEIARKRIEQKLLAWNG